MLPRLKRLLIFMVLLLSFQQVTGKGTPFANWTCGINKVSRIISYMIALPCEPEVNDCCYMHDRCYEVEHEHPLLYSQSDCDEKFCRCLNEVCMGRLWCRPIVATVFCAAVYSFGHKTYALHRFIDSQRAVREQ
ncbi:Phospholipase A2-like protein Y52B11A.8 [Toxocara canis]|uniref:Phospholipase A2-like protein Y52B11A.8 n=1 Tax=Toxocara canis TaxID=6265 RepID=A0A0B2US12_TOXCA|nr:Phospholipase A2-like protein Y52B11A.8 [Toxocara canis]